MKLMSERTTRLSVVVRLSGDAQARSWQVGELRLSVPGARREPLTHREGYWLVLDATPGEPTLSWTSTHLQDGQLSVRVDPASPSAPLVELALTPPPPVAFAMASIAQGRVGRAFRQALRPQGGKAPFRYEVSGLPPGTYLRQAAASIEGTPTRRGNYQVTLRVTDVNDTSDQKTFRLSVTA